MVEKFEGLTTALIVPMYMDGRIHWKDFQGIVEYQKRHADNLLSCGTTMQSPALDWEEHDQLDGIVINTVDGEKPVIAGAGSNNTAEAVRRTTRAWLQGADGTLHVTGYYNFPPQVTENPEGGLFGYFSQVAEAAPIPLLMYDVRGRGHSPYVPALRIALVRRHPNIIGVKEASNHPETWRETRRIARKHGFDKHSFKLTSGDDPNTYRMMTDPAYEGIGVTSVWGNLFAQTYREMCNYLLSEDKELWARANDINESLKELNGLVTVPVKTTIDIDGEEYPLDLPDAEGDKDRNPMAVQYAAYLLGMIETPYLRSPMGVLVRDGQEKVGRALYNLHEAHEEYFEPIKEAFNPKPSIGDRLMEYRE